MKHFVAIGQAKATGESELVSVGAKLSGIGQRVDGLVTFTPIEGRESCIPRATEELGKSDWVHFVSRIGNSRSSPRSLSTTDTLLSNESSNAI